MKARYLGIAKRVDALKAGDSFIYGGEVFRVMAVHLDGETPRLMRIETRSGVDLYLKAYESLRLVEGA